MSILMYSKPKPVDLAGNPLFLRFKGTEYVISTGVRAKIKFRPLGGVNAGYEFTITMMGQAHRFYMSATNPLPLPPEDFNGIIGIDPTKQMQVIVDALNNYPPISQYYLAFNGGSDVIVTAFEYGEVFNLSFIANASQFVSDLEQAGVDNVVVADYHFLGTLFLENLSAKGTYLILPEFRIDGDNDQIAWMNLSGIIKQRFRTFFDLPDFGNSDPVKALVPHVNYYMQIKEMSGQTMLSMITTEVFKALNGRVNNSEHTTLNIRDWITADKRFMTNQPDVIITWLGAKRYLYYMSPSVGTTTYYLYVKAMSNSGEVTYRGNNFTLAQDEVIILPVDDIIRREFEGIELYSASVYLYTDTNTVAGPVILNYQPKPLFALSLLFQNQYGFFDTLTTFVQANTLKTSGNENNRVLTPGYSKYLGDVSSLITSVEDIFESETGPVSMSQAQWYKEAMMNNIMFLQADDRFVPVIIETGSFKIVDEDDDVQNVKFKFKPAFDGDLMNNKLKLPQAVHKDYSIEYLNTDYQ